MTRTHYIVSCKCGYESVPLLKSVAEHAAQMHNMLGEEHRCKVASNTAPKAK